MIDDSVKTNLLVELKRGTYTLAVLSLLKKMQYGYSLLQELEKVGIEIEAGTLYPLLRRLEAQGLLKSEWDTTESRPRKYYLISEDGFLLLDELHQEWKKISIEMNGLLED